MVANTELLNVLLVRQSHFIRQRTPVNWENKIDPILEPACCFEHKPTPRVESLVASQTNRKQGCSASGADTQSLLKCIQKEKNFQEEAFPSKSGIVLLRN
jgi:hypothetical protein